MARGSRRVSLAGPSVTTQPIEPVTAAEAEAIMNPASVETQVENVMVEASTTDSQVPAGWENVPPGTDQETVAAGTQSDTPVVEEDEVEEPTGNLAGNEIARKKDFYKREVKRLGRLALQGELSLINLAETMIDGTIDGAIVREDAEPFYSDYRNPGGKATPQRVETMSANSFKSNYRKLEWFIQLGLDHGYAGKKFFNAAKAFHERCMADAEVKKSLKLTAVYEAVLSVVRTQGMRTEADRRAPLMSETEMYKLWERPDPNIVDAVKWLADASLNAQKALKGRGADEKKGTAAVAPVTDPRLAEVIKTIADIVEDTMDDADYNRFRDIVTPRKRSRKAKAATTATQATPAPSDADDDSEQEHNDLTDEAPDADEAAE